MIFNFSRIQFMKFLLYAITSKSEIRTIKYRNTISLAHKLFNQYMGLLLFPLLAIKPSKTMALVPTNTTEYL